MRGSCICGEITFEAGESFFGDWACSCENCRKWSGSAFSAHSSVPEVRFEWLSGEHLLASFEKYPGTGPRRFCSRCGTPMPSVFSPGLVHVPLGTLDGEPDLELTAVLTSALPRWASAMNVLPSTRTAFRQIS